MDDFEKTLFSETIYEGKILKLKVDKVELADGTTSFREEVEHQGGAAVLAEFEGKIALVKQFRYAYGRDILELPAGKRECGEEFITTAERELREEVGLKCERLTLMNRILPSPGYTNELIYVYYAENCSKTEQKLDKGEFLDVVFLTADVLEKMLDDGLIEDSKTVIGLMNYFRKKQSKA